jgi:putative FmdB family regulatory protein
VPIYDYLCSTCRALTEVIHGIDAPGPRFCPSCGAEGTLRKAFAAPTVHFKGSGWAKKDRSSASRARARSADDTTTGDGSRTGGKTGEGAPAGSAPSGSGGSGDSAGKGGTSGPAPESGAEPAGGAGSSGRSGKSGVAGAEG